MIASKLEIAPVAGEPGIILEPITADNFDDITTQLLPLDVATTKWLVDGDREGLTSSATYQKYLHDPSRLAWAIQVGNTPIGLSHLWGSDTEYPGVSTFITDERFRGKGLGTMAKVGLIATHVFSPEANREIAQTASILGNVAASRSLEKTGFYTYGYDKEKDGEYVWQQVDGESRCVPLWLVVNPHHTAAENEYADTDLGQASQAIFAARLTELNITVR